MNDFFFVFAFFISTLICTLRTIDLVSFDFVPFDFGMIRIINTSKAVQNNTKQDDSEKPYMCQFSDCNKRYRNSNGLKYHTKSVHTENGIKKEPQ